MDNRKRASIAKVYIASTEDSEVQIATIVDVAQDEQSTTLTLIKEEVENEQ